MDCCFLSVKAVIDHEQVHRNIGKYALENNFESVEAIHEQAQLGRVVRVDLVSTDEALGCKYEDVIAGKDHETRHQKHFTDASK